MLIEQILYQCNSGKNWVKQNLRVNQKENLKENRRLNQKENLKQNQNVKEKVKSKRIIFEQFYKV